MGLAPSCGPALDGCGAITEAENMGGTGSREEEEDEFRNEHIGQRGHGADECRH